MFDPTFVKYPSPYDLHHIPMPPPPPKQEPLWFRLAWVLLYTLLIALLGLAVFLRVQALGLIPVTTAPLAVMLLPWLPRRDA